MDKPTLPQQPHPKAEHVHQLREPVAVQRQANFFLYVRRLRALVRLGRIRLDEEALTQELEEVLSLDTPTEAKLRRLFGCIACTNSITALRTIEELVPLLSGSKREWALLSELQLRMNVIGDLVGEQQVALASGLGGEGALVRLNGVLVSQGGTPWLDFQRRLIHDELDKTCREHTGRLESEIWGDYYYIFVILLPYTSDMTSIILGFVSEVNMFGSFVHPDSLLTNIEELTGKDAEEFAQEILSAPKQNYDTPPTFDETDL